MKKELLKYCLLYSGKETSLDDNPYKQLDDEFKWYMWRVEWVVCNREWRMHNVTSASAEDYFKGAIKNKIDTYADTWAGGDPKPYYDRYFSFKK